MARVLKNGYIITAEETLKIPVKRTQREEEPVPPPEPSVAEEIPPLPEPAADDPPAEEPDFKDDSPSLEEYLIQGEKILENAKNFSEIIINNTLNSAREELNSAINAGYTDGFETGRNDALQTVGDALSKVQSLMDAILKTQDAMIEEFRDKMFVFLSEAVKKILHREISDDDSYLNELFADAVKNITNEDFITITISDAETRASTRNLEIFIESVGGIADFKVVPDKSLPRGTMIVETSKGIIDSSLDEQIQKLDSILERIKSAVYAKNESFLRTLDLSESEPADLSDSAADYDDSQPQYPDSAEDFDISGFYDNTQLPPAPLDFGE